MSFLGRVFGGIKKAITGGGGRIGGKGFMGGVGRGIGGLGKGVNTQNQPRPQPPSVPQALELTADEQFFVDGGVLAMASSNVEDIWWKVETKSLYVRFKDNSVYLYPNKSLDVVIAFKNSASPGRFVWNHLRGTGEIKVSGSLPTVRFSGLKTKFRKSRNPVSVVRVVHPENPMGVK